MKKAKTRLPYLPRRPRASLPSLVLVETVKGAHADTHLVVGHGRARRAEEERAVVDVSDLLDYYIIGGRLEVVDGKITA